MVEYTTQVQVSAGGVAFRRSGEQVEVALIAVGGNRWQLPKGTVEKDESNEDAAQREVREEAGVETELIEPIDKIEYWYFASRGGKRVRYHKYVYFFLMRYLSGDVADHDHEVDEARWVEIGQAQVMLSFKSEQKMVSKAQKIIADLN